MHTTATKSNPTFLHSGQSFVAPATYTRRKEAVGRHNFANTPVFPRSPQTCIQPKLTVNAPGDRYEQEADRMAEQVIQMQDTGTASQVSGSGHIQRKCAACEAEEETLMRKSDASGGFAASPALASQLSASKGGGAALPESARQPMEQAFGSDFSSVRIHTDAQAAGMSQSIQAKAFTHGSDIYFNRGGFAPENREGKRLLAHELAHTIQQEGKTSVALRDQISLTQGSESLISKVSSSSIQRDLTGSHKVKEGEFKMSMTTISNPGDQSGMAGTISFLPNAKGPDSTSIRLVQVVRSEDLSKGQEIDWSSGSEANRNKIRTTENKKKGIKPGFYVDHLASQANPRTQKTDPAVSLYYRDYFEFKRDNISVVEDGSKKGSTVTEAILGDAVRSKFNDRFTFETVAKSPINGHEYGSLQWGFTVTDPANGKVENEHAKARRTPSKTYFAAVREFDKFYRNPGSPTAPK